jgi:two-component system, chemotaxis family, chemotaxis protein CheY
MKVLVVDDDVVSRMVLMHLVDGCGKFEILEAEDGQQAWEQLLQGLRPAIVFCDLRMPRLSGMDLLGRVRAERAFDAMPFVLASSATERATIDQAGTLGATGYIVKPFQAPQVRQYMAAVPGFEAAASASETPLATMQRLGIGGERLLAYLGGLESQLAAAGGELGQLIVCAEHVAARQRVERLHAGCLTLGLAGAAASLAALGPGPFEARAVEFALAGALRAVMLQSDIVERMPAAS